VRERRYLLLLPLMAGSIALSACGGGSGSTAAPSTPAASAPAAAPASATDDAMSSDTPAADGASSPADATAGAGNAALPFNSVGPEPGNGNNDGPDAKIPQGFLEPAATTHGLGKDGNLVVSVSSTDTTCVPNKRSIPAGTIWFKLTNHSKRINEMYLETPKGDELIEVEKVKTGLSGAFKTTVKPGTYVIACEPGMNDKQVFTGITVTG